MPIIVKGTSDQRNELIFFYPQAQNYIRSLPKMERKSFSEVFKGANPLGKFHSSYLLYLSCNSLSSTLYYYPLILFV